jgi:hypothetical protein
VIKGTSPSPSDLPECQPVINPAQRDMGFDGTRFHSERRTIGIGKIRSPVGHAVQVRVRIQAMGGMVKEEIAIKS